MPEGKKPKKRPLFRFSLVLLGTHEFRLSLYRRNGKLRVHHQANVPEDERNKILGAVQRAVAALAQLREVGDHVAGRAHLQNATRLLSKSIELVDLIQTRAENVLEQLTDHVTFKR
ncbi:MAG: hypothetical protein RLZZ324_466 [Candidatus Parcubacteria bacterium]